MYARILVPLDSALVTEQVLMHVTPLAAGFNATVMLVHVVAPPIAPPVPVLSGSYTDPERATTRVREDGRRALDVLAQRLREQDITVETVQLEGMPARELADFARRYQDLLVVMADPAESGLGRFFSDRVAETLLHRVPCPVLLVPIQQR